MSNAEIIRSYIIENFLFGDDEGFNEDTSFLDEGIIDSTGIMELVEYIEKKLVNAIFQPYGTYLRSNSL